MQAGTFSSEVRSWKRLYTAALFEVDSSKLPDRIAQAEAALIVRARELFHAAGDNIEEEEAVDDAMYALRALRNTYQCPRPGVASSRAAA
ncbi:MAG: hypothetical protein WBV46_04945 [Terriglobales bacterium]|jgi:hypothetical protein